MAYRKSTIATLLSARVGAAFLFRTAEILSCGTGFASPTICPHGNDSPCRARGQPSVDIKLLTKASIASWGDLSLKPLTGLLDSKVRQSLSPPPESVVELPASAMYLK